LQRLRNWDIPDAQIRALTHSGEARRTLTFTSPAAGIVTEKKAVQGMRFMPGETLYQVTDLSAVWVVADVNEQDIGAVRPGSPVKLRVDAYPGETFDGRVSYIYPTLNADTRSVPVRIELANPSLRLKPAMFVHVSLPAGSAAPVLTVPSAAVLDSGTRRVVLVERGEGRFEPREVRLGARSARYVEVLDGVKADERVVVAANFLIDAESNLQAALGAFTATGGTPPAAQAASVVHRAEGQVDGADAAAGTVTLSHGPVASLNWPAMTMDFAVANPALQAALKPGARVAVDFVERKPGEWVITAVRPAAGR
ncbi:MAG TPA: efflux RND transporter periplasmic adaptor subunit, partial [Rhodocyclaceae bacterium]|nr:efflux RND transporter periplasmic adaptor subunit [Rhodocyclaceae bacterium]